MKVFMICPVRGHSSDETEAWCKKLEADGHQVHWPPRDTEQNDLHGGINICLANRAAIEQADMVAVVWDPSSSGSHFDLGMAFALRKPILLLDVPPPTEGKSFVNVLYEWRRE